METRTIRFIRRGELVSLTNVPPTRTLLEALREDLGCTGTKEGCGEGDCGACTVVLAEPEDGKLRYRAINSCIRLAHSVDGLALWTVEDLAQPDGTLHPAQEAMVQCHGSQCGFCTPGFVMSLFGTYQNHVVRGEPVTRELAQRELSGNLCRCTGYRPILDAAVKMAELPAVVVDEAELVARLEALGSGLRRNDDLSVVPAEAGTQGAPGERKTEALDSGLRRNDDLSVVPAEAGTQGVPGERKTDALDSGLRRNDDLSVVPAEAGTQGVPGELKTGALDSGLRRNDEAYIAPASLAELLDARAAHPDAQIVAGCTDVGLWITKQHRQFDRILDVTRVAQLRRVETYPYHLAIGAAVTLEDAFAALVAERPQLATFASRFAGLPVRNSGTLGGNVANGSPIGDSMPLLIALGAHVVLMSVRGHREMPVEDFYTGYRTNVLAADEVLAWVKVPRPGASSAQRPHPNPPPEGEGAVGIPPSPPGGGQGWGHRAPPWQANAEFLRVYKVSRRFDDDISAVCLAIRIEVDDAGIVRTASLGAGGVAATPARAVQTQAALVGQPWTRETVTRAADALRAEFRPISDMRASAGYRSLVLGNLLQRFWLESQGQQPVQLESFRPGDLQEAQP